VGDTGTIMWSEDGKNFQLCTTPPVGIGVTIRTVAVKSKNEWWIGTSTGQVWFTTNKGLNWTQRRFDGDNAGVVWSIQIQGESIIYFSHATAAPRGRIFMSVDGGNTFRQLPVTGALLPLSDRFTALEVCKADPELIVAAGLHDNGTDGIAVIGKM
jgi:photosystem II stability/assembly factor-like uncharacterized protein